MLIQKQIVRLFSVLCMLALMLTPVHLAYAAPLEATHTEAVPAMLQFTSSGNALGFTRSSMFTATGSHALRVDFVNPNPVQPQSLAAATTDANLPKNEGQSVPLGQVTYAGLWDGITLDYTAEPGSIYTTIYHLAPGANPASIRLNYNRPLTVTSAGALRIAFEKGALTESAPIAWQQINGRRVAVAASFRVEGQQVGFALRTYDPAYALTIEPSLVWNTFLEFTNWGNLGNGIAVDGSGNVFVTGTSHLTWGTPVRAFSGSVQDAYVAKLSPNGTLLWNTFLGGSGTDYSRSIAVDGNGNVLVTGTSDAAWGAPVLPFNAITDAFVAKLNSSGALTWNTFLGSSSHDVNLGSDTGNGITVDGSGNVFVTGSSTSTWGNPVRAFSTDPNGFASTDAFVAKLSSGGALTWNTFLGASGNALLRTYSGTDVGYAIAVDGSGNVFVSGTSGSSWGAPVRAFTLGTATDGYAVWATYDAFVAKLNSSGALTWNTFLGTKGADYTPGLAVHGGNVVVTGYSDATWGTPLRPYSGKLDAFAAQLNSNGALTWNTFLGASGFDEGTGVTVDGSGNVFVTGYSDTTWGTPLRAHTIYGSNNAFVAKLSSSGALQTNTFLGGINNDYGNGIALDGSGNVYITGWSENTFGTPLHGAGGNFVAKADLSLFPSVVSSMRASPNPSKAGSVNFAVTFSRAVTGVDKTDFNLTTTGVTGASVGSVSGSGTTYNVTVNTGIGSGFLRLDVIDDDSIIDSGAIPLGGPGSGNGNFINGQVYGIRVVQYFLSLITK